MPIGVFNAKDGTLFKLTDGATTPVDVRDMVGMFEEATIRVEQDIQDTTGPRDSADVGRPVRIRATCETTTFVLGGGTDPVPTTPTDYTSQGAALSNLLPATGWSEGDAIPGADRYEMTCDLIDGGTVTMTCWIESIGDTIGGDPNKESLTLRSDEMPTFDEAT